MKIKNKMLPEVLILWPVYIAAFFMWSENVNDNNVYSEELYLVWLNIADKVFISLLYSCCYWHLFWGIKCISPFPLFYSYWRVAEISISWFFFSINKWKMKGYTNMIWWQLYHFRHAISFFFCPLQLHYISKHSSSVMVMEFTNTAKDGKLKCSLPNFIQKLLVRSGNQN